jgi:hypothetical protein
MPHGPFTRITSTQTQPGRLRVEHINGLQEALENTPTLDDMEDAIDAIPPGAAVLSALGMVNVENHGVSTSNTAAQNATALNSLFADIKDGTESSRRVFFPNLYDIDTAILVDMGQIEVFGANRESSGLNQVTANTPVFLWDNESGDGSTPGDQMTHIHVHTMALTHEAQADGADTQQFGIRFRPSPDGSSPGAWNGFGWYLNCWEDLLFRHCYKGIGVDPDAAVIAAHWSSEFRDLVFWDTKQNALFLNDGGLGGAITNRFDNIHVLNYGMRRGDGGGNYATGYAIDMFGYHNATISNLNIEDWVDGAVLLQTCNGLTINGFRTERHDTRTALTSVLYAGDCDALTVNGYNNQLMRLNHGTYGVLFNAADGTTATINGLTADRASGSGTDVTTAIWGTPTTSRIILNGSSLAALPNAGSAGVIHETLESAWGTGLYTVVSRDGQPPRWDVLPTAGAAYVGRTAIARTTGVDTMSVCRQTASTPTYAWTALH